jgi:hypothetical protein
MKFTLSLIMLTGIAVAAPHADPIPDVEAHAIEWTARSPSAIFVVSSAAGR